MVKFLSFGPSTLTRLLRPLLTSAMRSEHLAMSSVTSYFVTHSRSPVISSTAFHARPPDLPPVPLIDMGFAICCPLARHRRPHHPVLVHRPACLLHASSRPHLAVTPLRFARPSPPSGWSEDFHLQAVEHPRRTTKASSCSLLALEKKISSVYGNPVPFPSIPPTVTSPSVGDPSAKRIIVSLREPALAQYSAK
jgi:hypothetical protein